jgi:hypothetical protein
VRERNPALRIALDQSGDVLDIFACVVELLADIYRNVALFAGEDPVVDILPTDKSGGF